MKTRDEVIEAAREQVDGIAEAVKKLEEAEATLKDIEND